MAKNSVATLVKQGLRLTPEPRPSIKRFTGLWVGHPCPRCGGQMCIDYDNAVNSHVGTCLQCSHAEEVSE